MISITRKQDCCGCNACAQICPKQCITMQEDNEGFLYPRVDTENCIDCHLCEKICPVSNHGTERKPLKVYAAINKDEEVRKQSSSGGIFTALAEQVIKQGGVVFGARFDERWQVKHDYTETMEGLAAFRGSKYVQSQIGNSYQEAERFLKAGRKVLFSGTPCQIAGLRNYLRKEYDNLLTVDFICHGVPSPMVWRRYLKEEVARQCDRKNSVLTHPIHEEDVLVEGISFRDKTMGWKKFSFALTLSTTNGSGDKIQFRSCYPMTKNEYLRGFMSNVYLRPSCYSCAFKCLKSKSDITLGDFWNIRLYNKHLDDNQGLSLMLLNNSRGQCLANAIRSEVAFYSIPNYDINSNFALMNSVVASNKRSCFYDLYNTHDSFIVLIRDILKLNFKEKVKLYMLKIKRRLKI